MCLFWCVIIHPNHKMQLEMDLMIKSITLYSPINC